MPVKLNIDTNTENVAFDFENILDKEDAIAISSATADTTTNVPANSNTIRTNTKSGKELITINGWNIKNQTYFKYCLHRLKYYRIINNFFFFELKKREGRLSWAIIVLSAFSSVLSLINTNSEKNIFLYSSTIVEWILVLITVIITLIGAYIKKQQFIDRINNIDRYLQQLNQTVEEFNITFILEPEKRESYDEFCKKYIPIIKNLSVSPASFSPTEWKRTVYTITTYYPELIRGDNSDDELLWPWFYMENKETINGIPEGKKRLESKFGETIVSSFNYLKSHRFGYSFLHAFENHDYYSGIKKTESKLTQTERSV
jgi:hypothetical protein